MKVVIILILFPIQYDRYHHLFMNLLTLKALNLHCHFNYYPFLLLLLISFNYFHYLMVLQEITY